MVMLVFGHGKISHHGFWRFILHFENERQQKCRDLKLNRETFDLHSEALRTKLSRQCCSAVNLESRGVGATAREVVLAAEKAKRMGTPGDGGSG